MVTGPVSSEAQAALDYLSTGSGGPCQWTDGGQALMWTANGRTVVFRDELLLILQKLAPNGLPRFPALVLLLAACRGLIPSVADLFGIEKAAVLRSDDPEARATVSAKLLFRCETTLSLLRQLDAWPRGRLAGTRAKTMLAAAVFEQCPRLRNSPAQAGEIVTGMRRGVLTEAALNQPTGRRVVYLIALRALEGLRDVTPSTLAARLQTGTDF